MLDFLTDIARQAGVLLQHYYNGDFRVSSKANDRELVTEADIEVEKTIISAIRDRFPDHAILAEEGGASGESDSVWIIDPIDGTNNFAHKYPIFSIAIAFSYRNELRFGVTYDPLRDELFSAENGRGATLNGTPIHVSATPTLSKSVVATGFPYDRSATAGNNLAQFSRIMPVVQGIRRSGSAAIDMVYVACGRLDGYWEFQIHPWDVASGILIVKEAGGIVTDAGGEGWNLRTSSIVAANPSLHAELLAQVRG